MQKAKEIPTQLTKTQEEFDFSDIIDAPPKGKKTFKLKGDTYDIPVNEVANFLHDFPEAKEQLMPEDVYIFIKKNNLTQKEENAFIKEYAEAKKSEELYSFLIKNNLTVMSKNELHAYFQTENNLREIYNIFSDNYDLGTFNQFKIKLQDKAKRKAFYEGVKHEGLFVDYSDFENLIGKKNDEFGIPMRTGAVFMPSKTFQENLFSLFKLKPEYSIFLAIISTLYILVVLFKFRKDIYRTSTTQ